MNGQEQGRSVVLLGPQAQRPTVAAALRSLHSAQRGASIALVSAGWEEREGEVREFEDHVGSHVVRLDIYQEPVSYTHLTLPTIYSV